MHTYVCVCMFVCLSYMFICLSYMFICLSYMFICLSNCLIASIGVVSPPCVAIAVGSAPSRSKTRMARSARAPWPMAKQR